MAPPHRADETDRTRWWRLGFEPDIERLYRAHHAHENQKKLAIFLVLGVVLFNFCLIGDYIAAPQYIHVFIIGRSLIVTPVCLVAAVIVWRKSLHHELWMMIAVTFGIAVTSGLIVITEGEFRRNYLFANMVYMQFGCVIARPRVRPAIAALLVQFLSCLVVIETTNLVGGSDKAFLIVLAATSAVLAAATAYTDERSSRRAFLLGLRIERLNSELAEQSVTDPLTGLANRRRFEQVTTRHWSDPSVRADPVSIVLIDIDHFKLLNDSYGHSAGDVCLTRVARCVAAGIPAEGEGLAVRFGGEEMLLFLPSTDFTRARQIAEYVRGSILREAVPNAVEDPERVVSASFGVATATTADCDAAELLAQADTALYAAKKNGRNQVWPPIAGAATGVGAEIRTGDRSVAA